MLDLNNPQMSINLNYYNSDDQIRSLANSIALVSNQDVDEIENQLRQAKASNQNYAFTLYLAPPGLPNPPPSQRISSSDRYYGMSQSETTSYTPNKEYANKFTKDYGLDIAGAYEDLAKVVNPHIMKGLEQQMLLGKDARDPVFMALSGYLNIISASIQTARMVINSTTASDGKLQVKMQDFHKDALSHYMDKLDEQRKAMEKARTMKLVMQILGPLIMVITLIISVAITIFTMGAAAPAAIAIMVVVTVAMTGLMIADSQTQFMSKPMGEAIKGLIDSMASAGLISKETAAIIIAIIIILIMVAIMVATAGIGSGVAAEAGGAVAEAGAEAVVATAAATTAATVAVSAAASTAAATGAAAAAATAATTVTQVGVSATTAVLIECATSTMTSFLSQFLIASGGLFTMFKKLGLAMGMNESDAEIFAMVMQAILLIAITVGMGRATNKMQGRVKADAAKDLVKDAVKAEVKAAEQTTSGVVQNIKKFFEAAGKKLAELNEKIMAKIEDPTMLSKFMGVGMVGQGIGAAGQAGVQFYNYSVQLQKAEIEEALSELKNVVLKLLGISQQDLSQGMNDLFALAQSFGKTIVSIIESQSQMISGITSVV